MIKRTGFICAITIVYIMLCAVSCRQSEQLEIKDVSEGKQIINYNPDQTKFYLMGEMSYVNIGYENNEILNELQEKTGIEIDYDCMNTYCGDKVKETIESGNLPDAFIGAAFSGYDIVKYGKDGIFINLRPYITQENMPNLYKILEENPDIKSAITMDDGRIYGLPAAEKMGTGAIGAEKDYSIYSIPQFSMINKVWLDDLGLEVPTTLDELYYVLKAFEENDMSAKIYGNPKGSTIPLSVGFDQWCWGQNIFYAGFGFTNWSNEVCNDIILSKDEKVEFVCESDNYREAVTYFHEWYEQGLIDSEMFTQSERRYLEKCAQGRVGVATWWYIEEAMKDYAEDYVFLPVLTGPDGSYNVTIRSGGAVNSGNLNITSACKNPLALLRYFDQWYVAENVMQINYGPIGVYFTEKNEKGLWKSITDEECMKKYGFSAGKLKQMYGAYGPKLIVSDYFLNTFELEDRARQRIVDLNDYWMQFVDNPIVYPGDCTYTINELEIIDKYRNVLQETVAEYEAKWIREGGPKDEEWEEYLDVLKKVCGIEELKAVYQVAYNRYVGK